MKCRYFCRLPLDISPVYLTRGISDRPAGKEIHRKADKPGKAETNKLALRQIEGQLGLNFG